MPVLVTLAAASTLFTQDTSGVSFLDPKAMRERCIDVIDDGNVRKRALDLTEALEKLLGQYSKAVVAALDAYRAETIAVASSATDLIELLTALDTQRTETLQGIIRIRQSLHELLTVKQWDRLFL